MNSDLIFTFLQDIPRLTYVTATSASEPPCGRPLTRELNTITNKSFQ